MLQLSDTLLDFLMNRGDANPSVKIVFDSTGDNADTGLLGVETDVGDFAVNPGSVTRELQLLDGIYRPGSHSFELANTDAPGDFLFTLRNNIALNTWVGKSYKVLYGYKKASGEEYFTLFRGLVQSKSENRIDDTVSVDSMDSIKELSDFKFCSKMSFTSAMQGFGFTNNRSIQPVLKYGIHSIISDKDSFSLTEGIPNDVYSTLTGVQAFGLWIFPWINTVTVTNVYFWDYIASIWQLVDPASYVVESPTIGGYKAIYFYPSAVLYSGDTFTKYLEGSGAYFVGGTSAATGNIKIAAGSITATSNPIGIILDILALTGISISQIDASANPITSPNLDYTVDYAWNYFYKSQLLVNVDYSQQTSALDVIQAIGKLCGFVLFYSADYSSSFRRNFKISIDRVVNTCKDQPVLLQLATNDNLTSLSMTQNADMLYDNVTVQNFDPAISTKDNFDICSAGDPTDLLNGNNNIALGDSNVYLYSSHVQGVAHAERLFFAFRTPIEIYECETDRQGIQLEIGDYVAIYDSKIQETVIGRVNNIGFDLNNKTSLTLWRYGKLYGPDQTNPTYSKWAFCKCANAGTDQSGGSNTSASVNAGYGVITLNTGDTSKMLPGMRFRIGGTSGGTSGSEYFTIQSIINSTQIQTIANATSTHTAQSWSAGIGYYAR